MPEADTEKSAGFKVIRVVLDNAFEIVDELLLALLGILGLTIEIVGLRIDVTTVVLRGVLLQLAGLFDEYLGPLLVFPIGQGHPPVSHCALGILGGDLPEGPLGLVVPEAVQLPDSLVEEFLPFSPGALNREGNLSGSLDGQGGVSRTLIEGFTLVRVARLRFALGGSLPRFFLGQGKEGSDSKQGCQDEVAIQDHGFNTNTDGPFLPSRFARGPFARELRINLRWKPEAISVLRRARWASLPRARLDSGPSGSERRVPSTAWFRSSGSGVIPGERPSS